MEEISDFIVKNANKNLFIIMITAAKKNITRLVAFTTTYSKGWIDNERYSIYFKLFVGEPPRKSNL